MLSSIQKPRFQFLFLSLLGLIAFLFLPSPAFAFSEITTHPALTEQIVDFYNLNYPDDKISDDQKKLMIQGSRDEDTPPRWINHFYDPIYFSRLFLT